MAIFMTKLPDQFLLLIPRGLFRNKDGGFSWYSENLKGWPSIDAFTPAIDGLVEIMANWPITAPWGNFDRIRLAGFSQGAALAYAFTLLHPIRVMAVAGLAGFLPEGIETLHQNQELNKLNVYVSHGVNDRIVPISKARQAAQIFDTMGARITFCESDVGHKLAAHCYKGLEMFFDP